MSNLFKFQGEKTDADNTGAKEKVAAKKNQRLWAMKHPQHQQNRSSLLSTSCRDFATSGSPQNGGKPVAGGFTKLVLHDQAEGNLHWCQGCSKQGPASPVVAAGMHWGLPRPALGLLGQRMMEREGGFGQPMAQFARSQRSSPKAFVFLYLMCYCNAVNIWANFWCRTNPSAPS